VVVAVVAKVALVLLLVAVREEKAVVPCAGVLLQRPCAVFS